MDGIYDDIDNYNDVNRLDELETENKELRQKLHEAEIAMELLKKEILQELQNLIKQHQSLTDNYSSLLKTARAEIMRKAETITQINTEKDRMVLRLNANKMNRFSKCQCYRINTNKKSKGKDILDESKRSGSMEKLDSKSIKAPSNIENRQDKKEEKIQVKKHSTQKLDDVKHEIKSKAKPDRECKENVYGKSKSYKNNDRVPSATSEDYSRRKTMPEQSYDTAKFSSDEEETSNSTLTQKNINTYDCTEISSGSYVDKYKLPVDEELHRKSYKEKWKSGREYRLSERHRRRDNYHYDKYDRREINTVNFQRDEYRSNDYYDHQYARQRRLESPPKDKRYRHRHQRHSQRSDFNKDQIDYDIEDRLYNEKQHLKHKIAFENDPNSKRRRTDSSPHYNEDLRRKKSKSEVLESIEEPLQDMQLRSCQSPDEISVDKQVHTCSVTEIMETGENDLEDPRLQCNRYINLENKTELTAVSGINVTLKFLKPYRQEINSDNKRYSTDRIVREVCVDEADKAFDLSVESGEITDSMTNEENNTLGLPKSIMSDKIDHVSNKILLKDQIPSSLGKFSPDHPLEYAKIPNIKIIKKSSKEPNKNSSTIESDLTLHCKPTSNIPRIDSSVLRELPKTYTIPKIKKSASATDKKKDKYKDISDNKTLSKNRTPKLKTTASSKISSHLSTDEDTSNKTMVSPLDTLYRESNIPVLGEPESNALAEAHSTEIFLVTDKKDSKATRNLSIKQPIEKGLVENDLELSNDSSYSGNVHSKSGNEIDEQNQKNEIVQKSKSIEGNGSLNKSIESKLCDLFGDSSLITPEDLELDKQLNKGNCLDPSSPGSETIANSDIWYCATTHENVSKAVDVQITDKNIVKSYMNNTPNKEIMTNLDETASDANNIQNKIANTVKSCTGDITSPKIKESDQTDLVVQNKADEKPVSESYKLDTIDTLKPKEVIDNEECKSPIVSTVVKHQSTSQDTEVEPNTESSIVLKGHEESLEALATSTPCRDSITKDDNCMSCTLTDSSIKDGRQVSEIDESALTLSPAQSDKLDTPHVRVMLTKRKRKRIIK